MQNERFSVSEKIVSRDVLATLVQDMRQQGKILVTTNGSFDLLHIGHVTMLREAKSLGDVLIVGMNSDTSVKRYKGKYRPLCAQAHRAGMLAALECVDYVLVFDELTPIPFLEIVRPDIHVNSPEHGYDCIEREVVEKYGGHIHLAQLIEGMSTTQLIQRILEVSSQQSCRAIFLNPNNVFDLADDAPPSHLFPPIPENTLRTLKQLCVAGFRLFFLAYHPEIAMGTVTEEGIRHKYTQNQEWLRQHQIEISATYLCPHHPNGTVARYRKDCSCRRPKPGLLEHAVEEFDVSLAKSFIVSHDLLDVQMGREANCKTILLKTYVQKEIHAENKLKTSDVIGPNYVVAHFQDILTLVGAGSKQP